MPAPRRPSTAPEATAHKRSLFGLKNAKLRGGASGSGPFQPLDQTTPVPLVKIRSLTACVRDTDPSSPSLSSFFNGRDTNRAPFFSSTPYQPPSIHVRPSTPTYTRRDLLRLDDLFIIPNLNDSPLIQTFSSNPTYFHTLTTTSTNTPCSSRSPPASLSLKDFLQIDACESGRPLENIKSTTSTPITPPRSSTHKVTIPCPAAERPACALLASPLPPPLSSPSASPPKSLRTNNTQPIRPSPLSDHAARDSRRPATSNGVVTSSALSSSSTGRSATTTEAIPPFVKRPGGASEVSGRGEPRGRGATPFVRLHPLQPWLQQPINDTNLAPSSMMSLTVMPVVTTTTSTLTTNINHTTQAVSTASKPRPRPILPSRTISLPTLPIPIDPFASTPIHTIPRSLSDHGPSREDIDSTSGLDLQPLENVLVGPAGPDVLGTDDGDDDEDEGEAFWTGLQEILWEDGGIRGQVRGPHAMKDRGMDHNSGYSDIRSLRMVKDDDRLQWSISDDGDDDGNNDVDDRGRTNDNNHETSRADPFHSPLLRSLELSTHHRPSPPAMTLTRTTSTATRDSTGESPSVSCLSAEHHHVPPHTHTSSTSSSNRSSFHGACATGRAAGGSDRSTSPFEYDIQTFVPSYHEHQRGPSIDEDSDDWENAMGGLDSSGEEEEEEEENLVKTPLNQQRRGGVCYSWAGREGGGEEGTGARWDNASGGDGGVGLVDHGGIGRIIKGMGDLQRIDVSGDQDQLHFNGTRYTEESSGVFQTSSRYQPCHREARARVLF